MRLGWGAGAARAAAGPRGCPLASERCRWAVLRVAPTVHDPVSRPPRQAQADTHDLETQDRTGASAYVLALKLGHTRAAHMLIRAGACPRAKTALGWEPIQLAALTANSDLTRIAVVSMLKDMDLAWERRLPKHLDMLRAMPGERRHNLSARTRKLLGAAIPHGWRVASLPDWRRRPGSPALRSPALCGDGRWSRDTRPALRQGACRTSGVTGCATLSLRSTSPPPRPAVGSRSPQTL